MLDAMGCGRAPLVLGLALLFWGEVVGCGGRTPLEQPASVDGGAVPAPDEICNRQDDDGDGEVDEAFRDVSGRYLHDDHCGGCGRACDRPIDNASDVGCELLAEAPTCLARECAAGFGRTTGGGCTPLDRTLCLPCRDDGDCGALESALCVEIGGEQRCARDCEDGCPGGYVCFAGDYCIPEGESCSCEEEAPDFDLACSASAPDGSLCAGLAQCRQGRLSSCMLPNEVCDGLDDDCDGTIDEGFVGELGTYSEDARNCGACGADCTADTEVELTCGGDPFAPSCVTLCPDTLDGVQVGDRLDADRQVDSGCECRVTSLIDSVGAPVTEAQLDSNCDGADGELLASFYVAIGGSDDNAGSPTRPLRTIQAAIDRAQAS
ncbi:MAG: MopE-related protein, partial [Myxococcales bacterium]|nr:MopE-related protein [Myxococcales bacterium]